MHQLIFTVSRENLGPFVNLLKFILRSFQKKNHKFGDKMTVPSQHSYQRSIQAVLLTGYCLLLKLFKGIVHYPYFLPIFFLRIQPFMGTSVCFCHTPASTANLGPVQTVIFNLLFSYVIVQAPCSIGEHSSNLILNSISESFKQLRNS